MAPLASVIVGALGCIGLRAIAETSAPYVRDVIFMADIGHPRDHADTLTTPWPMDKCALEGAFSLYEGLRDYIGNQGVRPHSIFIMGDIAYCGGDALCNNQTRDAFQKYTQSVVPPDRIFPMIGNHDVHYLGCSKGEKQPGSLGESVVEPLRECHYGTKRWHWASEYQMSFEQWRSNWITGFPGLGNNIIRPPPSTNPQAASEWLPPLRYNIDLGGESRVYFIAGLVSGVWANVWQNDTVPSAVESTANASATECRFLQDSLAHGRRLGKSVFIYMTHHFQDGCQDWDTLQQIDIWLYGHKHNQWQSVHGHSIQLKEQQYYPVKLLIGNGGFDEGMVDVVSFGRLREQHIKSHLGERVRLQFDIIDTCKAVTGTCPSSSVSVLAHCWEQCRNESGGYDGGGGGRRASPSQYDMGFTYEAPLEPQPVVKRKLWQLKVGNGSVASERWLSLDDCGYFWRYTCLVGVTNQSQAVKLAMYDTEYTKDDGSFTTRFMIDDKLKAPVVSDENWIIQNKYGYWEYDGHGAGLMRPSDGYRFQFTDDHTLRGLLLNDDYRLRLGEGQDLDVQWHLVEDERIQVIV